MSGKQPYHKQISAETIHVAGDQTLAAKFLTLFDIFVK
ncbi:MAG: hypothetical protein ACPGWR_16270 [Ardenticatenaceae bacterium]